MKLNIETAVQAFSTESLRTSALGLFAALGYQSDRTLPTGSVEAFCKAFDAKGVLDQAAAFKSKWLHVELLFQLTDEELGNTASQFKDTDVSQSRNQSYVFFAIELDTANGKTDYSRSQLAGITRRLNRVFPMPVMVLFKMGTGAKAKVSIAVINRRAHKRDNDRDVLGKVTLIQNIHTAQPHRGHVEILASFALPTLKQTRVVDNFDTLHAAWEAVFNVELLNKRFYEELANWYFWARTQVAFPADLEPHDDTRNSTSVIRLLTRLIFCWFLKEKSLIPNTLFSPAHLRTVMHSLDEASTTDSSYYRAILQNLFFATLNQEMNADGKVVRQFAAEGGLHTNRDQYGIKTLYRYSSAFQSESAALALFEDVPFLNGGLFACLDVMDDAGKVQYADGFSRNVAKQPVVPNHLFFAEPHFADLSAAYNDAKKKKAPVRGLIHILQDYKFTIAESTPVEQEIALDPELLGNVFENLLASYNPETGESARKQTGSFYTPRPIVDYMVDETLKAYLAQALCAALPKVTPQDAQIGLDVLFAYTEREHPFTKLEAAALIDAIHRCNILDPACGSGAYPMGILHKLVFILGKLDPQNTLWKERQTAKAGDIEDAQAREAAISAIERDFTDNNLDYGRKLYLIENCIFGVDIQPIAIQIAKLRFFISLVCDQKTNHDKARNLGVRPLPNLEIKFVAANTLIGLQKPNINDIFTSTDIADLEAKQEKIRHRYFAAQTRSAKLKLQKDDAALSKQILALVQHTDANNADLLRRVHWNPYDAHGVADFFDPVKMFGPSLQHGFDVVIGNPPYVQIQKFPAAQKAAWVAQNYTTYGAMADIYCLFYERGAQLLRTGGQLCYITSNKWMRAGYGEALRGWLAKTVQTRSVFDFGMAQNFGAAVTYTSIVHLAKTSPTVRSESSKTIRPDPSISVHPKHSISVHPEPVEGRPRVCYAEDAPAAMREPAYYFEQNATPLAVSQDPWVILTPTRAKLKAAVTAQGVKLADWHLRINRGILTGYNEAFYLTDSERAGLIAEEPNCEALIKPLLRGRSVQKYSTDWHGLEANDDRWLITTLPTFNLQESQLPKSLVKHLEQFRAALEPKPRLYKGETWQGRKAGSYQWFETQDAIAYHEDFTHPKIIYPNITKHMPFLYDHDDGYFANNANYILTSETVNLAALTAQFNSSLFRCCYKDNFPEIMGDSRQLFKIFFDQVPLKRPTAAQAAVLEALVLRVQAAKRGTSTGSVRTDIEFVEALIDACVMEMYFADEMARCNLAFLEPAAAWLAAQGKTEQQIKLQQALQTALSSLATASPEVFGVIMEF